MNDAGAALFRLGYRLRLGDHLARVAVLTRRPLSRGLTLLALYYGLLLGLQLIEAGSVPGLLDALWRMATTDRVFSVAPLLAAGLLFIVPSVWIGAPFAILAYRQSRIGERPIDIAVTSAGIAVSHAAISSRIGWAAIERLIETRHHLFLQLGRGEALVIPRRALPDEEHYRGMVAFIRARTGLRTGAG